MQAKRLRGFIGLSALSVALAACSSATNNHDGAQAGAGSATAGAGSAGAAGMGSPGASGSSGMTGDVLPPPGPCMPGVPVTTQIPLLLNRQYANVVRDLLGVTSVDNLAVADSLVGDF